jgi:hypothetical protein
MPNTPPTPPAPPIPPLQSGTPNHPANAMRAMYHSKGQFTVQEFCAIYAKHHNYIASRVNKFKPVNPSSPKKDWVYNMGEVCDMRDLDREVKSKEVKGIDELKEAHLRVKIKIEGEVLKSKKMTNGLRRRELLEITEVELKLANIFKILSQHLQLMPDMFEKRGWLKSEHIKRFIDDMHKVSADLQRDLSIK